MYLEETNQYSDFFADANIVYFFFFGGGGGVGGVLLGLKVLKA